MTRNAQGFMKKNQMQEQQKSEQEIVATLTGRGGRLWEKGGHRRIYFNADLLITSIGLRTTRYNSGNVSSATLNGKSISNSEAKRLIGGLQIMKIWYDLTDGTFYSQCEAGQPSTQTSEIVREFTRNLRTLIS